MRVLFIRVLCIMKFTSLAVAILASMLTIPAHALTDLEIAKIKNANTNREQNDNTLAISLKQKNLEDILNETKIDTHKKFNSMKSHNNDVHKNLESIDKNLDKGIQTNFQSIKTHEHKLEVFSTELDEQEDLVEELQTQFHKHTDVAKGLQNQFDAFKSEFNQYTERTNAAIAGVTALSMLPQPTSVGKGNFAVGVGHYKSETAAAVGFGYSINEHVTVKTGASYSKTMKRPAFGAGIGINF